ncbi:transposase [bacterium AH-315-L15]|nr:transposase [bacterium AH-315-L15]
MNRGRGRRKIYRSQVDYQRFLDLMDETCGMWGIRVHAYSLLPNHYHFLLETPRGNLSRALRHLDGIYTQRYNRTHQTDGPLFRGRYKAILIDGDNYLLQVMRYIHLNPVAAQWVKNASLHRWTSHRSYLGKGKGPVGLVMEEVLGRFHKSPQKALGLYRRFMGEGIDDPTRRLYERGNWPAMWGTEGFRKEIAKKWVRKETVYEIPQMKRERGHPSLKQIEEAVCRSYDIHAKQMRTKRRGYWNAPRNAAIYLARNIGGYRLREIGERWGGLQYSSASGMIYAMKRMLSEDRNLRRRLKVIEQTVLKKQT